MQSKECPVAKLTSETNRIQVEQYYKDHRRLFHTDKMYTLPDCMAEVMIYTKISLKY